MKKKYSTTPESMKNLEFFGFHWMEFVVSVPSPLYIMTSYKSNGQPNACMQSWTTFTGGKNGYFAIVSAVSKHGHLYQTLHETGEAVINADMVNAPLIQECFMNLECRFQWEKEVAEGDDCVLVCLEIVSVHIEERHLDESNLGRTGETGILYNIHHPIDPEHFQGTAHDYLGVIQKIRDYAEY